MRPLSRIKRGFTVAARSIASITVPFGMVAIPVKVYSAIQSSGSLSFNLLHPSPRKRPLLADRSSTSWRLCARA